MIAMPYFKEMCILTSFISLVFGIFVYFRGMKATINKIWLLMSVCVSLWSLGLGLMISATSEEMALFYLKYIHYVGAIFIPAVYLHFTLILIGKDFEKRKVVLTAYIIAVVFLISNFLGLFATVKIKPPFNYYTHPLIFYPLYTLLFMITVGYSLFLMFKAYRDISGLRRHQITYQVLATVVGFSGGSSAFFYVFNIPILPIGMYIMVSYNLIMSYAIIRYRLMDIGVVITRTVIFGVVYTVVLGIPFWIGFKLLGGGPWIIPISIMAVLATAGPFIFMYLQKHAVDVLQSDQRRYQRALIELSKSMGRIRDLDKLYKTIIFTVVDTIKIPFAAIYLKDEEYKSYQLKHYYPKKAKDRFQEFIPPDHPLISLLNKQKMPLLSEEIGSLDKIDLDHGLVIPCFVEDDLLGFLTIGAKPNNQMYTQDDLLIFETLSYSTALAIENCKFWKEIEDRQRKARLQEMDSFAYSLAHEIDNPMTVLLNLPNFLRKHFLKYISDPQEQKDVDDTCKHMTQLAERVSGMVKAIRKFGEPTTGELSPLNLQEIIEGYSKLYAPEIKAHSIYFEKEMPAEPIYVNGVAAELQQVLIIFSNNAIHAMKYAEPKKITLKLTKANHNIARIAFSDTGYGIKPEKIETIFAPFVTSKASTEGTGMGLYNAKGLILRHKGRIWAESGGPNKGATFIIELPIIEDVKPEDLTKKDESKWKF
jgi:signal transduction histidine kinase